MNTTGRVSEAVSLHGTIQIDVLAMSQAGNGTAARPLTRTVLAEYHETAGNVSDAVQRAEFVARFAACESGASLVRVALAFADGTHRAAAVFTVDGVNNGSGLRLCLAEWAAETPDETAVCCMEYGRCTESHCSLYHGGCPHEVH